MVTSPVNTFYDFSHVHVRQKILVFSCFDALANLLFQCFCHNFPLRKHCRSLYLHSSNKGFDIAAKRRKKSMRKTAKNILSWGTNTEVN
jgi:hypothetical protein